MRALENLRHALARVRRRPGRSLLLLQGTVWGVAVALFPVAVLDGTRDAVRARGAEVGADRIAVAADPTGTAAAALDQDDVLAVRRALGAAGVAPLASAGFAVARGAPAPGAPDAVLSGPPDAPASRGLVLASGRLADPAAPSPEAVVEGVLAREIAASRGTPLGAEIRLSDGRSARVVGALAERSRKQRRTNDLGFDVDHPVFRGVTGRLLLNLGVPMGDDGWKRTDRCAWVADALPRADWIYVRVAPDDLRPAAAAIDRALHARGKDVVVFYPPLYPLLVNRELDRFRALANALFLACLAMGGVVMANVGLLSAIRRAPEIAVHRVEGARRRDVALQFVAEGAILSVAGSLLGWAVACGLAEIRVAVEPLSGTDWAFPWPEAVLAALVALLVGVLAQALPARRAARQDPVEALVDE